MAETPTRKQSIWNSIGVALGKVAVWAAAHPELVQAAVTAAAGARK